MARSPTRLITIGASAGGLDALKQITVDLPADLAASVLVVQHVGSHPSVLPQILGAFGPLSVSHAQDGEPLREGHIHVAPPDRHLLVEGECLRLFHGAKEHHARPAIDPLFRTAAQAHGPGVIGVVLSGMLDDGTAGLQAIKERGGIAIVQDPSDALEPSMPASAIRHVSVDHVVPASRIARLLAGLTAPKEVAPMPHGSSSLDHEVALMMGEGNALEHLRVLGSPSTYVCPDCHGALWQIAESQPRRYRCHTGHGFSARSLDHGLATAADDALWNALRALQERFLLYSERAREQSAASSAAADPAMTEQLEQLDLDLSTLRSMLTRPPPADE
jgi:two-component system chemotaxis response regulator CheB